MSNTIQQKELKLKFATLFLLLIIPLFSHSETWKDSPYVNILKIYPNNGGLAFYPDYEDRSVSSCDRFLIRKEDENYEVKVSALLAAFMSGKKVLLRYDSNQALSCSAAVDRFIVSN